MPRKKKPEQDRLPRGKPQIKIDWNKVDDHLHARCTGASIADMIGCSSSTLYDRCYLEKGMIFSEYAALKREKGDSMLRKAQFDSALSGNVTMLIFLGKHNLHQHDKIQLTTAEPEVRTLLRKWEEQVKLERGQVCKRDNKYEIVEVIQ